MTPVAAHIAKMKKYAHSAYEHHVLFKRSEGERWWWIREPYEDGNGYKSSYSTEIYCTHNGQIMVCGDIDPCIFAYGPQDPKTRVRWMGKNPDIGYYVLQKASIGMARSMTKWADDVARAQIKDALEDNTFYDLSDTDRTVLHESLERMEDQRQWQEFLWDSKDGCDLMGSFGSFGEVPDPAVIYAHAALARLCAIWELEG